MAAAAAVAAGVALGATPAAAQQTAASSHVLDRANLDTTCAPCTDFFTFANGGWEKRTSIPAAYSSWGSFNELQDHNETVVHSILDDDAAAVRAKHAKPGTDTWKVGTLYEACMDTTAIEALGTKPIEPMMQEISSIGDTKALLASLGKLDAQTGVAPFGFFVRPDSKNSSEEIANAGQGGLGLPEREYYFRTDDKSKALRDAYVAHVATMLQLSGESSADASANAQKIMDLETRMAQASMPRVAMRDPNATYHKMTLADMQKLAPDLDLQGMLHALGAPAVTEINVAQPDFFRTADTLLTTVPVDTWKAYLRWHVLANAANALPSKFADENFKWSQRLTGVQEQLPRWKRCAAVANGVLGEAIGQEYVKRTFTPAAKARALTMVDNLIATLRADIGQLTWMSDATKKQAIIKLDAFTRKIGYPDKWKDYSKLEVESGQYLADLRHANDWRRADNWSRLGKPVDRTEWGMTPPTVNAYYNPQMNEIVFPAGILQPPFFDPNADDAVNYGAMGAVIGHEMTHGFDDQGRQFDPQGQPARLVDGRGCRQVRRAGEARRRPVRQLHGGRFEHARERQADGRREHRRPGRPQDRVPGHGEVAPAKGPARSHRRLHARAALLPRLGAGVARGDAARNAAHVGPHERARAGQVARQWSVLQHAGVQGGVGLQGRRPDGPPRQPARAHLVAPSPYGDCLARVIVPLNVRTVTRAAPSPNCRCSVPPRPP